MKKIFQKTLSIAIGVLLFLFVAADVWAQEYEDCGDNFSANYTYEGLISPPTTTGITIPLNSDFRTRLRLTAEGDDDLDAGENVDIVLVMDRSGSMNWTVDGERKIKKAKEALVQVVSVFESVDKPENRLGLVTYNASVTLDQTLTSSYDLVNDAVDSFSAGGMTNIGGALSVAANHLDNNGNDDSRKFIVIATDGVHNTGTPVQVGISNVPDDITVYSVGIGDSSYYDEDILTAVAGAGTGEGEYYASDVANLTQTFEDIIRDILTPFRPENVVLAYIRKNIDMFTLQDTDPNHDIALNDEITWENLGSMENGDTQEIDIDFLQASGYGIDLELNQSFVEVTYDLFGRSCIEQVSIDVVKIDNLPQCTGAVPANSQMCTGDDAGLTVNVPRELGNSCTEEKKCEYICPPPFVYENGACRILGKCGPLEDELWCRLQPSVAPCSDGFPMGTPEATDSLWTWTCKGYYGGSSEHCNATRLCPKDWEEVLP
ncbi:MAG: vWA domain-containing protein [Patescibacteria group bacterium]|nr:vWA domain-containing protein [Patescibacteria group bacterium]